MSRARAAPAAAGRERQEQAQASASVQMRQQVEVTITLQGGQGLAATEEIWRERIPPKPPLALVQQALGAPLRNVEAHIYLSKQRMEGSIAVTHVSLRPRHP